MDSELKNLRIDRSARRGDEPSRWAVRELARLLADSRFKAVHPEAVIEHVRRTGHLPQDPNQE